MLETEKTKFSEVLILRWKEKRDNRGTKICTYSERELQDAGIPTRFVEETIYRIEKKETLFGIPFQNRPKPHAKIVYCLKGGGTDVIVDLRHKSPTFKEWMSIPLDSHSGIQIYIPAGFGHAFLSTEDDTHIVFRIDDYFDESLFRSISYKDSDLNIPFNVKNPVLSKQDTEAPFLKESDCNL